MNKKLILIIFGLSGFAALVYEITWIRPLSLVFGTSIYAVSTIIAAFILGLAIGSWLAGRYSDRMKNPLRFFAFLQAGIGIYGLILLPIFALLPEWYLTLFDLTYPNQYFFQFIQVVMAMALISIPATMMGTTLPLMMRGYSLSFSTIGKDVGKLDASNSAGAVIGTLAAGFILIPVFGIQNTIFFTAMLNISIATAILVGTKGIQYRYVAAIILITIGMIFLNPGYDIEMVNIGVYAYHGGGYDYSEIMHTLRSQEVLFYKESLYGTVLVYELPGEYRRLSIDGKTQCATIPSVVRGLENFASIPYEQFVYNYGKPESALNVGMGCGITSKYFSERTNTTTVEIDPVVVEANKFFFDEIDHRLIIDDGRNWLFRNDQEKFDIITTEPFDPFVNNGAMYTLEYFELLNSRISEKGVVAQWVPTFEMTENDFWILYNTFHHVFPYVYVYKMEPANDWQWIFVGSQHPLEVAETDLFKVSSENMKEIETVLNTDDLPVLEFSVARNIYD